MHKFAFVKLQRLYIVVMALLLALTGCHSSKKVVGGGSQTARTDWTSVSHQPVTTDSNDPVIADKLVAKARKWIGTPYRHGGKSRKGTDCSGMVMVIFEEVADVKLPRDSRSQRKFCRDVPRDAIQTGDLVFFDTAKNGNIGHVGLYIGNGEMIHASASRGVMVSNLDESYWRRHYAAAGRVEAITFAATGRSPKSRKKKGGKADKKPASVAEVPSTTDDLVTDTVRVRIATKAIEIPDSVLYEWMD